MSGIRRKRSEQWGGATVGGPAQVVSLETARRRCVGTATAPAPAKSTIAAAVAAASAVPTPASPVSSAGPTAPKQTPTNGQPAFDSKSKLVFGLGSRTNRVKHDEYAERRGAAQRHQQQQQQAAVTEDSRTKATESNRLVATENGGRAVSGQENTTTAATSQEQKQGPEEEPVVQVRSSKIRASKYGNFYKPQDLLVSSRAQPAAGQTNLVRTSRSPIRGEQASPSTIAARSKSPAKRSDALAQQQILSDRPRSITATTTVARRRSSPTRQKAIERATKQAQPSQAATSELNDKLNLSSNQVAEITETDSRSNMKELRGETGQQKLTASSNASPGTDQRKKTIHEKQSSLSDSGSSEQQTAATNTTTPPKRMQFNIPPPPQLNNSVGIKPPGGGSVVSYAKSRIYDKPTRQQLLSGTMGESILDSGAIPESILSGFKPPKQVNVSKAREKWEGGEPFAKCKSRQRLAAQANKKLLHGAWSTSSVVAQQQLQLQQVMSNSKPGANAPVKILTRGSVLERVQQFEKSPSGSNNNSSSSSSGSTSPVGSEDGSATSTSSSDDLMAAVVAASMPETGAAAAVTEAGLALQQPMEPAELRPSSPISKQAIYKSRVSSIQTQPPQDPLAMIGGAAANAAGVNGPKSPQPLANYPSFSRPNVRRRSSTASNSSSSIPKFYHPNGKPNTYEIELQKKNIVACFDKFPDRKALISGPTCRRHFHSIALACGFSEYFKEPLLLYVKHQMTKSQLLHNTSSSTIARQHRQSGIGPAMVNGTSVAVNKLADATNPSSQEVRPLMRAASIDNSTMEKIQSQNFITCEQFLVCWRHMIATAFDNYARFVHLLTMGHRNYLIPDDFVPLIQSVIDDHPGLKFLRAAPDFHMRYIQTVIARFYFNINKSWTGKISLAELRHSNLLAVLEVLSQEEDINQITDYFSYEHFYVIYCKFWSLDQDHDLLISEADLAKHNDAAISSRIIERIFMGIVSKQTTGKMSYTDFVWFLMAEEDKKHPRSIEYWFRLMDIDGDGYISMYEMEYFYYEQTKRLELMNIEALPFIDCACQILDLVNPKEKNKISLADLKQTKMATIFFDTFINLEKYLEHESREFVSTRDVVQDGVVISDWDRYASEEYESLVSEESSV